MRTLPPEPKLVLAEMANQLELPQQLVQVEQPPGHMCLPSLAIVGALPLVSFPTFYPALIWRGDWIGGLRK